MHIEFHRSFKKQFQKLPTKVQKQFHDRLKLFEADPNNRILHTHRLSGDMSHYISINVTSDVRALFTETAYGVVFEKIGTHSELY